MVTVFKDPEYKNPALESSPSKLYLPEALTYLL